jgi:hypothetical protein
MGIKRETVMVPRNTRRRRDISSGGSARGCCIPRRAGLYQLVILLSYVQVPRFFIAAEAGAVDRWIPASAGMPRMKVQTGWL